MKCLRVLTLSLILFSVGAMAEKPSLVQPVAPYPRLNKIQFQVVAEQWVETETAKVIVSVDANVGQEALDKLQSDVVSNLNKLSKSSWRMTQYRRNQDQSGLEKVHIELEARLPEAQLATLRSRAKSLSKPGIKYRVMNISYSPSVADTEAARETLRENLYKEIGAEIKELKSIYADQAYYVHSIQFVSDGMPIPMPASDRAEKYGAMAVSMRASGARSQPNAVSRKLTMAAVVELASSIKAP